MSLDSPGKWIEVSTRYSLRLINAGPCILVSAGKGEEQNLCTAAWLSPCAHTPPALIVALGPERYTARLIREHHCFTINIPDTSLLSAVKFCGSITGEGRDKFSEAGLTMIPGHKNSCASVAECRGAVECVLENEYTVNDHILFIGKPVYTSAEKGFWDTEAQTWNTSTMNLIHHLGGNRFSSSTGL